MDDSFEIPVTYHGEELAFTSRLLMSGWHCYLRADNGLSENT